MAQVYTLAGLVPRERLEVRDIVTETEGSRDIATEWYLDGVLVRRDGWVNVLAPMDMGAEQG